MKILHPVYLIFIISTILSSCKKDEATPANNSQTTSTLANTHFKFSLDMDGQHYSAEDGLNGYYNYTFAFDQASGNLISWTNYSIFSNSDTNSVIFEIIRSKLKGISDPMNVDDFRQFFYPGNHNFSTNPDSGIVIVFGTNSTTSYSSGLSSDQTGSRFLVTDTITETDVMGPYYKFKAIFNCNLYDQLGNQKVITNGMVVCKFQPYQ